LVSGVSPARSRLQGDAGRPEAGQSYASKLGYPAKSDKAARDVSADDFDLLIIPGGYAPDHMRRCEPMIRLASTMAEQGKVVAAICHGPWLLCSTQALKDGGRPVLLDQGRRHQRRGQLRGRRGDARWQPHHESQARRPAGVHAGGYRGSQRSANGEGRCGALNHAGIAMNKPIRIKLYGFLWLTKQGYLLMMGVGGSCSWGC